MVCSRGREYCGAVGVGHVSHAENFGYFKGERCAAVQAHLRSATEIFRAFQFEVKFIDVVSDVGGRGKG
jgi:hypothetical protein